MCESENSARDPNPQEWYRSLSQAISSQSLTILAGSAVSKFPPTALMTGWEAATHTKRLLLEDLLPAGKDEDVPRARLKWLIEDSPFESVMAALAHVTSVEVADSLVRQLFRVRGHNAVHEVLARLMLEAAVPGLRTDPPFVIVTTNYDCGIEDACEHVLKSDSSAPRFHRVVRQSDERARARGWPILYKIHGSVDCDVPMVYTHDHEARLDRWKYRLLKRSVDGRTLLMIGYSGRDLDVFPAIAKCDPVTILAPRPLERLEEDPHGFKSIVDRLQILGDERTDLRVPLAHLARGRWSLDLYRAEEGQDENRVAALAAALRRVLTRDEMGRWLGHLLVHTGAWEDGLDVLSSVEPDPAKPSVLFAQERADALFYAGKYVSAAEAKRALLGRKELSASTESRLRLNCDYAAFLNCAGDAVRAWKALLTGLPDIYRLLARCQAIAAGAAVLDLLFTAIVSVPFLSLLPLYRVVALGLAGRLRYFRSLGSALVLERTIEPLSPRASLPYLTLGQRAAQVNVYRYRARAYTGRYRGTRGESDAQEAEKYWRWSAVMGAALGDYPGLVKAYFGLTQLYMLQGKNEQAEADRCWREAWRLSEELELAGWRRATVHLLGAWADRLAATGTRGFGLRTLRSMAGGAFSVR